MLIGLATSSEMESIPAWKKNVFDWRYGGLVFVCCALTVIAAGFGSALGLGADSRKPALILGTIAMITILMVINLRERGLRKRGGLLLRSERVCSHPDSSRRVWLVAAEPELQLVLGLGEIEDQAFEPIIFRVWRPTAAAAPWGVAIIAFMVLVVTFVLTGSELGFQSSGFGWLLIIGCLATASIIAGWIFPSYTRITPGRIEVLNRPLRRSAAGSAAGLSLRDGRVIVDFTNRAAYVEQPDGKHLVVKIVSTHHAAEVAHAILRAAVSTAKVPALPRDELVG